MPTIRGDGPARIAWGYRTAATLGAWTIALERDEPDDPASFHRRMAAAVVGAVDLFALRQRPLTFVVERIGRPALVWPIVSLEPSRTAVRGELGPKEGIPYVSVRAAGK